MHSVGDIEINTIFGDSSQMEGLTLLQRLASGRLCSWVKCGNSPRSNFYSQISLLLETSSHNTCAHCPPAHAPFRGLPFKRVICTSIHHVQYTHHTAGMFVPGYSYIVVCEAGCVCMWKGWENGISSFTHFYQKNNWAGKSLCSV